jgi:hypothetical protein
MLKRINIQSLMQAKASLSGSAFEAYLGHYGIEIKNAELMDLSVLAAAMRGLEGYRIAQLDNFHIGYKIPQIGKEFDLLRFGKESIVNIELKSECAEEQILAQLLRNRYYLSFIGRAVLAFTFVSKTKTLYYLTHLDRLEIADLGQLLAIISNQLVDDLSNPDALFDPSAYLVSPFNSTERFLAGEYFLTHQQEEAKARILNLLQPSKPAEFVSITGSAGTGKTLLTYDVAKVFIERGMRLLIIHCGNLNEGHIALNSKGWDISPAKELKGRDLAKYDLIVVDEAQRIYDSQLKNIMEKASQLNFHCIFSYDKIQTLHISEAKNNVAEKIEAIKNIAHFKLSDKIRTNKEIATFIKMLFKNSKSIPISSNGNIQINYFQTLEDAKQYLDDLDKDKWEVLRFTPSQYNNEHHEKYSDAEAKTAHKVIGQEFDAVAIAIDQYFKYDQAGDLIYVGGTYYASVSMLRQNITRARKRLNIVLINNEPILTRCLGILS